MELDLRALNENRLKENIFTHDAVHTQKQYREMQFVLENESDIERGCAHKKNICVYLYMIRYRYIYIYNIENKDGSIKSRRFSEAMFIVLRIHTFLV